MLFNKNKSKKWIKIIAIGMVCLFFINNICWAIPVAHNSLETTLATQSIFQPLRDEGIQDDAELLFDLLAGTRMLLKGNSIDEVNTRLRKIKFLSIDNRNPTDHHLEVSFVILKPGKENITFQIKYTDRTESYRTDNLTEYTGVFKREDEISIKLLKSKMISIPEPAIERHIRHSAYHLGAQTNRTNHLVHKMINTLSEEEGTDVSSVLTVLYMVYYIEEKVGVNYIDALLSLIRMNISKEFLLKVINVKGFENRAKFILGELLKIDAEKESETLDRIIELWPMYGMSRESEREKKSQLMASHAYYLRNAGKGLDAARRELVSNYRNAVQNPFRIPLEIEVFGINPTYACDNNCRHCQIVNVPLPVSERKSEEERHRIYDKALDFAAKKKLEQVVISGGEPIGRALEDVLYILRHSGCLFKATGKKGDLFITTNSSFAKDLKTTENILNRIWKAFEEGVGPGKKLILQLSIDSFHQEVVLNKDGSLREKIPIANVANVIQCIIEKFPDIHINILNRYSFFSEEIWGQFRDELRNRGYYIYIFENEVKRRTLRVVGPDGKYHDKEMISYLPFLIRGQNEAELQKQKEGERIHQYISDYVNAVGWAQYLYPFEYAVHDEEAMVRHMSKRFGLTSFSADAGIDQQGNVNIDGSIWSNLWSLGNVEEGIEEILDTVEIDPLFIFYRRNQQILIEWVFEALPSYVPIIMAQSNLGGAMYQIMKSPAMRLYLTKRAILVLHKSGGLNSAILNTLEIPSSEKDIIEMFLADYANELAEIEKIKAGIHDNNQTKAQQKGSLAGCLETIIDNETLLRRALNDGFHVKEDLKPLRLNERAEEFSWTTVYYREVRGLEELGLLVPAEGREYTYRFADILKGPTPEYTKEIIKEIVNIEFKTKHKKFPLTKYEVKEEAEKSLIRELIRIQISNFIHTHIKEIRVTDKPYVIKAWKGYGAAKQQSFLTRIEVKTRDKPYQISFDDIDELVTFASDPNNVNDRVVTIAPFNKLTPSQKARLRKANAKVIYVNVNEDGFGAFDLSPLENLIAVGRAYLNNDEESFYRLYELLSQPTGYKRIPLDVLKENPILFIEALKFFLRPITAHNTEELIRMNERMEQLLIAA